MRKVRLHTDNFSICTVALLREMWRGRAELAETVSSLLALLIQICNFFDAADRYLGLYALARAEVTRLAEITRNLTYLRII